MNNTEQNSYLQSQSLISTGLIAAIVMSSLLFLYSIFGDSENEQGAASSNQLSDSELVIAMRNAPTVWYQGPEGPTGIEFELADQLAKTLNRKLRIVEADSVFDALHKVSTGQAHIAAAGITRSESRESTYAFSDDFQTIQQQVVCQRNAKKPKNLADLAKFKLMVVAGTSYVDELVAAKTLHPNLTWTETNDFSTEQLLQRVSEKKLACTVADSNIAALNRRYFPGVQVAFPLTDEQGLAWVIPNKKIRKQFNQWLNQADDSGQLGSLRDKYYGQTEIFDYVDIATYHRRIRNRLPKYQKLFQQASKKHPTVPWTLLAAQGYQESHWDAKAKSPTGVRGIMMLTRNTAKSLGVTDRLDPKQSIFGGAQYLAKMLKRVPKSVTHPEDRLRFALAAYNIGMAHMYDAQTLAERLNKSPTTWQGLKQVLPLLSQKKYYKTLKRGYARGSEPVRYIERIDNYRDILEATLQKTQTTLLKIPLRHGQQNQAELPLSQF